MFSTVIINRCSTKLYKTINFNHLYLFIIREVKFDIGVYYMGVHNNNMECTPHQQIPRPMIGLCFRSCIRSNKYAWGITAVIITYNFTKYQ